MAAGLEHHLARLVGLAVGAGHGVGVGQVAGHHVEPLGLRADGAAGDAEDGEHGHGTPADPPGMTGRPEPASARPASEPSHLPSLALDASSIVRTLPLMKRSVASYLTALSAKLARSRSMSTVLRSRLSWLGGHSSAGRSFARQPLRTGSGGRRGWRPSAPGATGLVPVAWRSAWQSPCRGPRSPACRRWRCCWRSAAGARPAAPGPGHWKSSVDVSRCMAGERGARGCAGSG
jgi:hypothetical protein